MIKMLKKLFCCVFVLTFVVCNLCGCSEFNFDFLKMNSDDVAQSDEQLGVEGKAVPYTTFF